MNNFVKKHMDKLQKPTVHKNKKQYSRKDKHRINYV